MSYYLARDLVLLADSLFIILLLVRYYHDSV
jgi:hypothetical protein